MFFVCYVLVSFISYFLFPLAVFRYKATFKVIRRGADKSLALVIACFPICSTTKRIFLGCVKEVRTTKSYLCGAQGEYVE
jgi:hypothetical protein